MGRESSFQASALEYLNSIPGCIAENVSGDASQSGRPDINGCYKGRAFKLELKQPDNKYKVSLKQNIELRRWGNAGCVVGVAYSREFIRWLFEQDWEDQRFIGGMRKEENNCLSWATVPDWSCFRR